MAFAFRTSHTFFKSLMNVGAHVTLLGVACASLCVQAQNFIPKSDDDIIEVLPPGGSREDIAPFALLQDKPIKLSDALEAASALVVQFQSSSDPRLLGHAKSLLTPWLSLSNPQPDVLFFRAFLKQNDHDFRGALADLDAVIRAKVQLKPAYLMRSGIYQVLGEYDAAKNDCMQLPSSSSVAQACVIWQESFRGHAIASLAAMERLLLSSVTDSSKVYVRTALGEIAIRIGKTDLGERSFKKVLAVTPNKSFVLNSLVDLYLKQRRYDDALTLLKDKLTNDGVILRLAIASRMADDPRAASYRAQFEDMMCLNHLRRITSHLREEALYNLLIADQPAEALRLAHLNWQSQKEPLDIRLFAKAAVAVNDRPSIDELKQWLGQTHYEDIFIYELLKERPNKK